MVYCYHIDDWMDIVIRILVWKGLNRFRRLFYLWFLDSSIDQTVCDINPWWTGSFMTHNDLCIHDTLTTMSNGDTYLRRPGKYILIYEEGSNPQSHDGVLPASKGLNMLYLLNYVYIYKRNDLLEQNVHYKSCMLFLLNGHYKYMRFQGVCLHLGCVLT